MELNIVGGGISGLAAGYFAARQGFRVRVFESASELGGLSGYFPVFGGVTLEKYYHHIFCGHSALMELMNDLGMSSELSFRKARMGFYSQGRVYPFAGARDLLNFTPLKFKDRLRLGMSSLLMMRIRDWRKIEGQSAIEWLTRHSGAEACDVVWSPLLKMKFGDNYDRISAAWLWNRVVDRRKAKGHKAGSESLGYIQGGYKRLFDQLADEIRMKGGEIFAGRPVDEICVEQERCSGVRSGGVYFRSDTVLATIPLPSFLEITPCLTQEYKASLRSIGYQGSTCVVLKLSRSLSKFYWINISDPKSPFVGIIEHTNLVDPELYGGRHFIYLTRYSANNDPVFARPAEDVYDDCAVFLGRVFPQFSRSDVEQYWVFRDRFSQPIFVTDYSKRMPGYATPLKDLYMLNTAQLYPESRCLNSSIARAAQVVEDIRNANPPARTNGGCN